MKNMSTNKILLVGGGGHCKSVLDSLISMNYNVNDIFIVDPKLELNSRFFGALVIGNDNDLLDLYNQGFHDAFITVGSIGNSMTRQKLATILRDIGFSFPNIIDCSSHVSSFTEIGVGVFIGKGTVVNADSKIGDFCILNSNSIIEHDCLIGNFSHISPGAVLNGNVNIGSRVHVGSNSTIKEGTTITDDVIVGMGSIVLSNIIEKGTYYGVIKEINQ